VAAGSTVTFTYVVTNTGNVPLANVVVTDDKLGPITTFTGDVNGNGLLDLGETWTFTATAVALPGQQTNLGTVTAQDADNPPGPDVTDNNPGNYFGQVTTPEVDLVLTKVADPSQVMFGMNVTFTLTVSNLGPDTATDVVVMDPLPAGLVFVSATPSQGTYAPASGVWMVGTLPAGASATLQVTATVVVLGSVVNTAEAAALQPDPTPSNNVAAETVTGTSPGPILSKRDFLASTDPDPATAGDPPLPSLETLRADVAYINGLYRGLLGRDAEPAGIGFWMNSILLGGTRSSVAQGIWDSAEHRGREVDLFYLTLLHRPADANGRAFWVNALQSGASEADVEAGFLSSAEYRAARATDAAFVAGLYHDLLGRAPDTTGQAFWLAKLQAGLSPEQVAAGFLSSQEALRRRVDADYAAFLDRTPDAEGRQFFLDQLFAGGPGQAEAVGVQILASDEFFKDSVGA
jgi:uncharacterized repeat protein (TIGR01451 family)